MEMIGGVSVLSPEVMEVVHHINSILMEMVGKEECSGVLGGR